MKLRMIFLIGIFLSIQIIAQNDLEEQREKFDPKNDPFKELKTVVEEAGKSNKRILLDVGGEWCKWCHILDKFIEENPGIKEYLHKHYVVLKVNYSEENKNEKFLSRYPAVDGYPHFFVLEKDGKFLHSQNTALLEKEKSYDPEKMMKFLKKWALNKK